MKGWTAISDARFYADASRGGALASGLMRIDAKRYLFDASVFNMKVGLQRWAGETYLFDKITGSAVSGWQLVGGRRLYFDPATDSMARGGWYAIGSARYRFDGGGETVGVDLPVPLILQNPELPAGCEAVALTELLRYKGFFIGKTDIADRYLPLSSWDWVYSFAGHPRWMVAGCANAALPPAIVRAGNGYLSDQGSGLRVRDVSGLSAEEIYSYLRRGVPVEVWSTERLQSTSVLVRRDTGGRTWRLCRHTHAVVVKGYDAQRGIVYVADPISGTVERDADRFWSIYDQMGRCALLIE